MSRATLGFTLVELSIVLVIMGLLVGGVLTGQSLIHAAELRAVTTEADRYRTAINTFRDKYFALPGDMPNAVKYWGAAAGGTADGYDSTCKALTTATGTATCNGNGDGQIGDASFNETFRFWQHLSNAGLIEGGYSGVSSAYGATTVQYVIGTNVPKSKLGNAGWSVQYMAPVAPGDANEYKISDQSGYSYAGSYGNVLTMGALGAWGVNLHGFAMKAEDAYNIDKKMDDGKPNTGIVYADSPYDTNYQGTGAVCASRTAYEYDLTQTGKTCILMLMPR